MAKEKYDENDGVWRTIGGRKVFIRKGQSLADAMIESGKFKKATKTKPGARESYRQALEEDKDKEEKTIHSQSGDYTKEELDKRDQEIKDLYKSQWNGDITPKELNDKLEALRKDGKVSYGELSSLQYDASREFDKELEKPKEELSFEAPKEAVKEDTNWRNEIKKNNDQLEKDLEEYKNTHNMAREDEAEGYYELFRENERKNAKLKQENPDEKYEFVEAYATYRDKRDKLEGVTKDENGNRNYDNMKDATWTGKEYTNDEFLENLEDENWHTERKMLLDANLTNAQMEFVKNNTTFHNGSPSLDKEITEELIKGAKGEDYKKPDNIIKDRNEEKLKDIKSDLDYIAKNGSDENVKNRYTTFNELKDRYKQLTGEEYDDSNIKIPYDENKTYEYPNGLKLDQKLMQERYSGVSPEKIQQDIDSNKAFLMNYSPKDRELHNAEIKEMEKYLESLPKYESRISDEFGTKDWEDGYGNQWGESSWKGTKSNSGLYGKDKLKAIDDEIKKAYPEIKTSRKTHQGGYTDSFSYNIMESDKPLVRSIDDFSDTEIDRLYHSGYNENTYNTKEDFKEHLKQELGRGKFSINTYNIDDDYRLTPYGKQLAKDIMKVSDSYNYDESASQVDYYHTGHYFNLGIGKDDKPYQVKESSTAKTPKSTNETMNNAIREKASKNNTIPRDYEKITYTSKIDTNAGKKGDKFELYKDEYGTHTKNLRTGETYQANMSMMKSPEAVEINEVVKKQAKNSNNKVEKSTNETMNQAIRDSVDTRRQSDDLVNQYWKKYAEVQNTKQFNKKAEKNNDLNEFMQENGLTMKGSGVERSLYKDGKKISYLASDNVVNDIKNKKYLYEGQIGLNNTSKLNSGDYIRTGDTINYKGKLENKTYENIEIDDDGNVWYGGYKLDKDRIIGKAESSDRDRQRRQEMYQSINDAIREKANKKRK